MLKRNKPWIPGIVIHYQNLERCKEFLAACREIQAASHKQQATSSKLRQFVAFTKEKK